MKDHSYFAMVIVIKGFAAMMCQSLTRVAFFVLFPGFLALGTLASAPARAGVVVFETVTGATESGGLAVDAKVAFTTSMDTIKVVMTNLVIDPTSVAQNLSDLAFTLSTGQSTASLTSGLGMERTVNADHTFTNGLTVAAGWVLSTAVGGQFHLDDLTGTGHAGPAHTILGDPKTATQYTNANSSIAGNGPHNPFLHGDVTFLIHVVGVTAASTINTATFSFGTTTGNNVAGHAVPEPSSLALLGLGTIGFLVRRRRAAVAA